MANNITAATATSSIPAEIIEDGRRTSVKVYDMNLADYLMGLKDTYDPTLYSIHVILPSGEKLRLGIQVFGNTSRSVAIRTIEKIEGEILGLELMRQIMAYGNWILSMMAMW